MNRRVVITGCGIICPLGQSREAVWDALTNRRSGVKRLESIPTKPLPIDSGAEVNDFSGHIDDFGPLPAAQRKTIRKGLKVMCREIKMGVAATQLALVDAKLAPEVIDADRTGVVFGSDYIMTMPDEFTAGIQDCSNEAGQFDFDKWPEQGLPKVTPLWLLKYLPNMPACHVAIYNDLRGPNNSITVREASSNLALAEAYSTIARGSADVILTGATGTRIHPLRTIHTVLQEELAVGDGHPERLSRPFDLNRRGMVVGEGAGTLVLEELGCAQARNALILGEVKGYGSSTVIDRQAKANRRLALENAMLQALRTAGLRPDQIGHINAHGLGTRQSDLDEALAIRKVFQDGPDSVPVVAAKSYFGNLGAASGMVELITSLVSLEKNQLFETLNQDSPDPECGLNVITGPGTPPGESVLSVNVTPQGQASAIVIGQFSD